MAKVVLNNMEKVIQKQNEEKADVLRKIELSIDKRVPIDVITYIVLGATSHMQYSDYLKRFAEAHPKYKAVVEDYANSLPNGL